MSEESMWPQEVMWMRRERREDPDWKVVDGHWFPKWLSCGNYRTPAQSPYAFGAYLAAGPRKKLQEEGLLCDYDDRLQGWHWDRWQEARKLLGKQSLASGTQKARSAFLSHVYGFEVESLQVFRGCNVGNGYPYLIFVSRRVPSQNEQVPA